MPIFRLVFLSIACASSPQLTQRARSEPAAQAAGLPPAGIFNRTPLFSGTIVLHLPYGWLEGCYADSAAGCFLRLTANAVVSRFHSDSHASTCVGHRRNDCLFFAHPYHHAEVAAGGQSGKPLPCRRGQ